jgi:hypothetical protein
VLSKHSIQYLLLFGIFQLFASAIALKFGFYTGNVPVDMENEKALKMKMVIKYAQKTKQVNTKYKTGYHFRGKLQSNQITWVGQSAKYCRNVLFVELSK